MIVQLERGEGGGEECLPRDEEALDECFLGDGEVEPILEDAGGVRGGEDFEGEG